MRIVLGVAGALFIITGGVWFLQGINVLPGSFMTGQSKWAIYGAGTFALGIILLIAGNRKRGKVR